MMSCALILIGIVLAIGLALASESRLAIQRFGFDFWRTETWDPVLGEFGARPFIWGTLYSSVLALIIATPVALGIAIVFNFAMYWFSDRIAIAASRSKPVTERQAPELYGIVRELAADLDQHDL